MRGEKQHSLTGKMTSSPNKRRRFRHRTSNHGGGQATKNQENSSSANVLQKLNKNSMKISKQGGENIPALKDCGKLTALQSCVDKVDLPGRNNQNAGMNAKGSVERRGTGNSKGASIKSDRPMPAKPSNPLRFKTELCRAHEEGGFCRFGVACAFAHGPEELRSIPRHHKYKTEECRSYHSVGYCQYGIRCHFVHDSEDTSAIKSLTKSSPEGNNLSADIDYLLESIGLESIGASYKPPNNNILRKNNAEEHNGDVPVPALKSKSEMTLDKDIGKCTGLLPTPPFETSKVFKDMLLPTPYPALEMPSDFLPLETCKLKDMPVTPPVDTPDAYMDMFQPTLLLENSRKSSYFFPSPKKAPPKAISTDNLSIAATADKYSLFDSIYNVYNLKDPFEDNTFLDAASEPKEDVKGKTWDGVLSPFSSFTQSPWSAAPGEPLTRKTRLPHSQNLMTMPFAPNPYSPPLTPETVRHPEVPMPYVWSNMPVSLGMQSSPSISPSEVLPSPQSISPSEVLTSPLDVPKDHYPGSRQSGNDRFVPFSVADSVITEKTGFPWNLDLSQVKEFYPKSLY